MSLQITIRSISDSPAIEYHIAKYFKKLNRIYSKLISCKVVIDVAQNHKHKGKLFSVGIDMIIPGKELISRKQNQNLYVAIRACFAAIAKLLEKNIKGKTIAVRNAVTQSDFLSQPTAKNKSSKIQAYCQNN